MKFSILFLTSFSIVLACQAEPPRPSNVTGKPAVRLTLAAATEAALANNPRIVEARAKWEAYKARVPQAAAWDDPKISTSTSLGRFVDVMPNSFTDHMLTVEQMIPISGKNRTRARIAAAEALGAWEDLRRRELDVVMKVRVAFARLVNTRALLELNRANEASLMQTQTISRAKFEVGTQTQAEVLLAETEVIRSTEARRDLERIATEQETQLKVLMNKSAFSGLGEPVDALPTHARLEVAVLRSEMLNARPEVRIAKANVTAAEAKLELARREWIPDPTVSVGAQRYNQASQAVSEVTAGVSFNVPWLNGRKYRAEEREAVMGIAATKAALETTQKEALGLLRDQLAKVETFHHHVILFEERLLPTLRQALEANRTGYENDKTGFLELVTSQRTLIESESMHRQHLSDYQAALAELEAMVGADLNLFPAATRKAEAVTTTQRRKK